MKKYSKHILSFIIPCILCLIVLYLKGILNNVEEFLVSDLRAQDLVFFEYLKNVLLGKASILYSYSAGLGNTMLSTIIFYCISPINILIFLINDIRIAIITLYIIKLGLAGLSMHYLLVRKYKNDDYINLAFSSCYALCSFAINYFFIPFWMDTLYLTPLVIIGIDKLIENKKINPLYIVSLSLAIICNIQMGFGLCVFSVIYFLYSLSINYEIKKDKKQIIRIGLVFIISSLFVGAISSGSLLSFLSTFSEISKTRSFSLSDIRGLSNAGQTDIGYIINNLLTIGNITENYSNSYEPYAYCGLIITFLSILYIFNKKIDKKKRISAFIVLLVFIISFCNSIINIFWHLSPPVSFNFRYAIYLTVFLTIISYENYLNTEKLSGKEIFILSVMLLLGLIATITFDTEKYITYTIIFIIIDFIVILLVKNKNSNYEKLLLAIMLLEAGTNCYLSIHTSSEIPYNRFTSLDSVKELASKKEFDDTYRIMYNYSYTEFCNDTLLLNKNSSPRYFSSIINSNVLKLYERTGEMSGITNYTESAFSPPLMQSLLGTKYLFLTDYFTNGIYEKTDEYQIKSHDYAKGIDENKEIYLFENPYALSLGYIIENDVHYQEDMDIADYQNAIIKAFTGSDKDVIIKLETKTNNEDHICDSSSYPYCISYIIKNNTNNKLVYAYSPFSEYTVASTSKVFIDVNKPLTINTLDSNVNLVLRHNSDLAIDKFIATTYDKENLISSLNKLKENSLSTVKFERNKLYSSIDASKDGILLMTIPYDKSFKIYVDEKEIDYYPLLDNTFIGFNIEKGHHEIKMIYENKKYIVYIVSPIVSLVICIIISKIINKQITKRELEEEKIRQQNEEKNKINKKKKNKKHKKG